MLGCESVPGPYRCNVVYNRHQFICVKRIAGGDNATLVRTGESPQLCRTPNEGSFISRPAALSSIGQAATPWEAVVGAQRSAGP